MVTAHSFLYQSRPGDARNTFRNSSSPASCSRCASRNRFTSSSARSGANFVMALVSALKVVSVCGNGGCFSFDACLARMASIFCQTRVGSPEAGRDDVLIDDAGARVDLDAAALAVGHAVAAAPHKGLLSA